MRFTREPEFATADVVILAYLAGLVSAGVLTTWVLLLTPITPLAERTLAGAIQGTVALVGLWLTAYFIYGHLLVDGKENQTVGESST